ncbi:MAG: Cdc6/Cdc18 family protein [archaeon]
MDIDSRIRRHRQRGTESDIVLNWNRLNPVAHVEEPIGRGPFVERILDHLDPAFDGALPASAYVWGPPGSGKSVVLTALCGRLTASTMHSPAAIETTTRVQTVELPRFVYVDARSADSTFQLYRRLLDELSETGPPQQGVSTDDVRNRLRERLSTGIGTVVTVDHVDEDDHDPLETLANIESIDAPVSVIFVGQTPPSNVDDDWDITGIEIPGYSQPVLIDVLMTRASAGLAQDVFTYEQARRIAAWAGGNAHDALAGLFGAAVRAKEDGATTLRDEDISAGIEAVTRGGRSLGVVLSLPPNRQAVLRSFLDLTEADRSSVTAASKAIAQSESIDLSAGTVKRYLYELAEDGIFDRVTAEQRAGKGRPPSRLEPRFPTIVFETVYDFQHPPS